MQTETAPKRNLISVKAASRHYRLVNASCKINVGMVYWSTKLSLDSLVRQNYICKTTQRLTVLLITLLAFSFFPASPL